MSKESIVENIYFALYKYDSEQNVLNKALYLSTATTLLKALIQREGLNHPIELVWYHPKKNKVIREKYNVENLLEKLDEMTQKIARVLGLANKQEVLRGTPVAGDGVYWMQDLLNAMSDVFTILEPIKQTIIEILILAGYDNVKLTQIDEIIGTKTTRNTELARL